MNLRTTMMLLALLVSTCAFAAGGDLSGIQEIIRKYSTVVFLITYGIAAIFGVKHGWKLIKGSQEAWDGVTRWGIGLFFIVIVHYLVNYIGIPKE